MPRIEHDKTTDVAFCDVEEAAEDAVIRVQSVSDVLGLKLNIFFTLYLSFSLN